MSIGNSNPARQTIPDVVAVGGIFTGGGAAADCTKNSADWNRGIASVKYNAATGKYRITFTDVGQQVVSFSADVARVTTVTNALVVKMVVASLSVANKTLDIEICDVATPTGADLATTDKLMLKVEFAKNAPP